jgi:hypothetical protein
MSDSDDKPTTPADGPEPSSSEEAAGKADPGQVTENSADPNLLDDVDRGGARNADAGGDRRGERRPKREPETKRDARGPQQQVTQNYYGGVYAGGAVFGVQNHEGRQPTAGTVTGRLPIEEVAAVVARYARPDCFGVAAERLANERVLVIEGKSGIGRRAGAVALLSEVDAVRLTLLSPSLTLRQLAERDYDEGRGYLVVDRFGERNSAVSEFSWSSVRDQVCEARAYLVVTAGVGVRGVSRVAWTRPPADEVLLAHLTGRGVGDDDAREKVAEIAEDLPDEVGLSGLANVAELIATGTAPADALKSLKDTAADEVRSWFAEEPEDRKLLEAAALCFLEYVDVRSFEFALDRLQAAMVKRLPGKSGKALARPTGRPLATRAKRVPLMHVKEMAARVGTASVVVFKDEEYGRCVLAELWRTQDNAFWDGIAEWLDEMVVKADSLSVARGLAALACAAFEEVNNSFLQPWSWGTVGLNGQFTAIYTLWYMCHGDLAPVALQTAVGWAGERDIDQRWSAVVAFGGALGLSFAVESVNQLWVQLIARTDDLQVTACGAIAQLFAGLTDDPNCDAKAVLALLDMKMRKYGLGIGAERMRAASLMRFRALVMAAALAVLEVNSFETGQPAIIRYLDQYMRKQPDRLEAVARLWAAVLRHRPHRRRAILALRRSLRALRELSDEPREDARRIGAALARALPEKEHELFKRDFNTVNRQQNRGQKDLSADVLLACLDAISRILPGGAA